MSKSYILVITSKPDGWPAVRLRQAAKSIGITVRYLDPHDTSVEIDGENLRIRSGGRRIAMPSVVIPRLGPGNYEDGLPILELFQTAGIPVLNSASAITVARDTIMSLLALKKVGLNVPKTARLLSLRDLRNAREFIPGPPWILKTFTGAMGIGTVKVDAVDQLEAVAATIWALHNPILMQEYLHTSDKTLSDYRTLIIGGKIIGAIKRTAIKGEYRANVHQGGIPKAVKLSRTVERLVLRAAKASGLDLAGVDFMETTDGPVFLEVNATPGFQGFEQATGIDVAKEIIKYAAMVGGLEIYK